MKGCSLFIVQIFVFTFLQAQQPIGYWREHLPYKNTIQVVKANKLYCATTNNVFSIDADNELQIYSKVTGLNDVGVSCIAFDDVTQQLIIAYNNSNVDVLKNDIVKNIGDIKRTNFAGNKTINNLYCNNGFAYASTGLGIIVINLIKLEIKDTWVIGNNGLQTGVNNCTTDGSFFYAATNEGLKKAPTNSSTLANYQTWQNLSGGNGLSNGAIANVVWCNNKIIVQKSDSLFVLNNNNFNFLYSSTNWQIQSITSTENKIVICHTQPSGASKVVQLNTNAVVEKTLTQAGVISLPKSATIDNGNIWVADFYAGLSKFTNTSYQTFIPNGPPSNPVGQLIFSNNILYAAAGAVNDAWNYQYNRDGIFNYQNGVWNFTGYYNKPILDSVLDFITLAQDPLNKSIWAGSYGGGLVNFNDNQIKIYKKNNSTLQAAIADVNSYRIAGLAFDNKNNLWISNYAAPQNLQVKKADGSFKAITIPFTHFENAVSQIVVDDDDQLWIVSPRGNGVFCYNYGSSVDAITDDKWKMYKTGIGTGNLPSNNIYCIAKDKTGFVWIGTDKGIAIVQCPTQTFTQHCDAIKPTIQQDAFAGFLFQDEEVQCIAIDGANRKWVGTKKGLWLISTDGDKILYHFTQDNSPLLNNDVKQLAIHPTTGEVFIATFKGLCSFRSTATEPNENNNNILVFPNPVPPNFNGIIGIKGLVNNANVKITELNGTLVFKTRALGGQAVWNGKNYKGQKVASGIYLVFVKDDSNTEKAVAKIVFVAQ